MRQILQIRQKTAVTKLLQSATKVYYKVRQVHRSVTMLFKNAPGITKCEIYYKMRHNTLTISVTILTFLQGFRHFFLRIVFCFQKNGSSNDLKA